MFGSSITVEDAFKREANMKCSIDIKAREVAFALRSEILKVQKTTLPENLTIKDILKREVQLPHIFNEFFNNLICSPDIRRSKSANKARRVKSISEDAIFTVTSGLKSRQNICN